MKLTHVRAGKLVLPDHLFKCLRRVHIGYDSTSLDLLAVLQFYSRNSSVINQDSFDSCVKYGLAAVPLKARNQGVYKVLKSSPAVESALVKICSTALPTNRGTTASRVAGRGKARGMRILTLISDRRGTCPLLLPALHHCISLKSAIF